MEYEPRSTLVVPETRLTRASVPFVDAHAHLWRAGTMSADDMAELIGEMDAMNMAVMVNLSGGSGERLRESIANTERHAPGRIVHFANVDFDSIGTPGWSERAEAQFREDVASGARGLKIFKSLGLSVTDSDGQRVAVDDPRIAPVWEAAGELGVPVLIHSADPAPFWEPYNAHNERYYELTERPNRRQIAPPSFEDVIGEQHAVFRRHPQTTFINAHLGWYGNDLARLGELLDEHPNVVTELGAVLAELGRQPRTARQFLIDYQDRVLMGKDSYAPEEYHVYFRVFETDDDYIEYYRRRHANWRLYGLDLPADVLAKVYAGNARRIIPGLDASAFAE
ncbi:amidohydrolase [Rubricoccus marinus]|uniref:Amidohydrolase n=2 Tax=Rubricoccus marinus TaxID=716817 RepID=A0A259U4I6_9BACT|nr:amidohydrolase [Rubricoccus marinus]